MRCPQCEARETRVVDSRDLDESATIRRRRECTQCGARFTTYDARLTEVDRVWLSDAQTSGGLLIAVAADAADRLVAALEREGTPAAAVIGSITTGNGEVTVTGSDA